MTKTAVLEAIGETHLSPSAQIEAALAANDRIKYYFSLLQTAVARADHPEQQPDSLQRDRLACGIENPSLDELAPNSRKENGHYRLPGCAAVFERIGDDSSYHGCAGP